MFAVGPAALPQCHRDIPSEQQSSEETKGHSLFMLASGYQACFIFKPTLISQEGSLTPLASPIHSSKLAFLAPHQALSLGVDLYHEHTLPSVGAQCDQAKSVYIFDKSADGVPWRSGKLF